MKLIDITEPGQAAQNKTKIIAVGIDLGTTNSLVAVSYNQKPQVISDMDGNKILPSIINYFENSEVQIGPHPINKDNPHISLSSTKRLMGKSSKDLPMLANSFIWPIANNSDTEVSFSVFNRKSNAIICAAEVLKALKKRAEDFLKLKVTHAVITVPAHFDDAARSATKDAAKLAGLEVLRLINEPTAAAFAYGLDLDGSGITLVYDLGGGTFDVSILNMQQNVFQVLATGGDSNLGGDDFDTALAQYFFKQIGCDDKSGKILQELMPIAKNAKEILSQELNYNSNFKLEDQEILLSVSRTDFENLIKDKVKQTMQILQHTLNDADITIGQVKDIVLVGGSTRIAMIKRELESLIGKTPQDTINPEEIVAIGAALQAENLTSEASNLLIDVNPLSLGLETLGGLVEKIIYRNTPIPISVSKEFTNSDDSQTAMQFHIIQGERELVSDCRSLAFFELGFQPQKAGSIRIRVTFALDADGLLTVTAVDTNTNKLKEIMVKASYGLDFEQIEQMLIDSYQNAETDINKRLLLEAKLAAEQMLTTINTAFKEDAQLLSTHDRIALEAAITKLQQLLTSENRDEIKNSTTRLATIAENFMTLRMNKYLEQNTKGIELLELEKSLENK